MFYRLNRKNKKSSKKNSSSGGYISVALSFAMLMLGLYSTSQVSMVSDSVTATANNANRERAALYASAGIEYGLRQIYLGQDPVQTLNFESGTAEISVGPNQITVKGKAGVATVVQSVNTAFAGNCMTLNCSALASSANRLSGVKFINTCPGTPILNRMKISITPDEEEKFVEMQVNGEKVYEDATGVGSNSWASLDPKFDFPPAVTLSNVPIDYFEFDNVLTGGKTYTFTAEFADRSTATATCLDNTASTPVCGNASVQTGESCDDGNLVNGDGCNSSCSIEEYYECTGNPSSCVYSGPICGNGAIEIHETCDDWNLNDNDGCSSGCLIESGYTCMGTPSSCAAVCGDGLLTGSEACDDGNVLDSDGCSSSCSVESGYACAGYPSTCSVVCGDGILTATETCDDGNSVSADGCSSSCAVEYGYVCSGTPSACEYTLPVCGNNKIETGEECDDGDASSSDGCSSSCAIESNYTCSGEPSVCVPIPLASSCVSIDCSNLTSGNDNLTTVKFNNNCTSTPVVNRMKVDFTPDHNEKIINIQIRGEDSYVSASGAGSGQWMDFSPAYTFPRNPPIIPINFFKFKNTIPAGKTYTFTAEFSDASTVSATCSDTSPVCGNGNIQAGEACDDGNSVNGDGCSSSCVVESTHTCTGDPSVCSVKPLVPGFTNNNDGSFKVNTGCTTEFKVLCTEITYGVGGPAIPVKMNRAKNGVYFSNWMFHNKAVEEGDTYSEVGSASQQVTYKIQGNAKYGSFNATYESTNTKQVKTLVNGSTVPTQWAGFGGQKPVSACVANYVDSGSGKIKLASNQLIQLFELGVDMTSSPNSPAADFQDLVVLSTIKNCP